MVPQQKMWRRLSLVAVLLTVGTAPAGAVTPLDFIERFLADPGAVFAPPVKPRRKPRTVPATTPLVDVPLPHLRPTPPEEALAYQNPAPLPTPTAPPESATKAMPDIAPRTETQAHAPAAKAKPVPPAVATATPPAAPPAAHVDIDAAAPPLPATAEEESDERADTDVPLPHLRPEGKPVQVASLPPPEPQLTRPPPAAMSTCGIALARLGVEAEALAPIEEGQCGIAAPVAVASLDDGAVDFTAKAIIACDTAETLANWMHDTVEPLAEKAGGKLTGIRVADSYSCRNRDNLPDTKLSEHAKGNAIDISAFRIDKRWVTVKDGWQEDDGNADKDFLVAVRKSACGPFKTVLGPGADVYHTDHFHLDLEQRRHGGTFCQ